MNSVLRAALWHQFGAAIDMLDAALRACPDEQWDAPDARTRFWYVAYHTLFFLDYYLSDPAVPFAPPAPFTLSELDASGPLPERVYGRDELRWYLRHGRSKCRGVIEAMTDDSARQHRTHGDSISGTMLEILLYNLRHVQHHTGQLNLLLRQRTDSAPGWIAAASDHVD